MYSVNVPAQYQKIIQDASARTGVPADLLAMVFAHESGWNHMAIGDHGSSFGLAQIHLPAHPDVTRAQAEDPYFAINWTATSLSGIWNKTKNPAATIIYHNTPAGGLYYARTGKFGPSSGLGAASYKYLSAVLAPVGGIKGVSSAARPMTMRATLPVTNEERFGTGSPLASTDKYDLRSNFLEALKPPQELSGESTSTTADTFDTQLTGETNLTTEDQNLNSGGSKNTVS